MTSGVNSLTSAVHGPGGAGWQCATQPPGGLWYIQTSMDGASPLPSSATLDARLERLRQTVRSLDSAVVAYSGGFDSALVLALCTRELGERAIGLTAVSPSLPERERADAARIAAALGARHELVESAEIHDPAYVRNAQDRCFHCKTELYRLTEIRRAELGFAHVVNGTNLDDLGDYRPGLEAATKAGVRSPLVEASLRKDEARDIARALGMDFWDKPAAACLSSRIPYGTAVTPERLSQVERLEDALQRLGLRRVRVRHHGDVARIEVGAEELERAFAARETIVQAGRDAGYLFVALDLAGYATGSLNRALKVVS